MRSHHFGTSFTHFDPFIGANFRFGSGRIGTQTAMNTVVAHVAGIAGVAGVAVVAVVAGCTGRSGTRVVFTVIVGRGSSR